MNIHGIIINYKHTWNGDKMNGPHLIPFSFITTIANKTYINYEKEIKDVILIRMKM